MFLNQPEYKNINSKILVISTTAYIFSYLLVYFIYQLTTVLVASQYHVRTILFFDKITYITQDNSPFWYSDSVLTVFSASPVISIIFILTLIWLYHKFIDDESIMKHILLWGSLHFINRLFGTFIIGSIFYLYESNLITDWLYIQKEMNIILVSVVFIIMIIIGRLSAFPLLASANSPVQLKESRRKTFIVYQVFLPWLIGSIILFVILLPNIPVNNSLLHISILTLILPLYFRYKKFLLPSFDAPDPVYTIPWRFISLLFVFIILLKYFLGKGMQFGSETESNSGIYVIIALISIIIIALIINLIIGFKAKRKSTRKLLEEFKNPL